jgi:hypothetical protein
MHEFFSDAFSIGDMHDLGIVRHVKQICGDSRIVPVSVQSIDDLSTAP